MSTPSFGILTKYPCEYSFQMLYWARAMLRYIETGLLHDYKILWTTRSQSLFSPSEMIAKKMFADFDEAIYEMAQKCNFKNGMKLYWHAYLDRVGKCTKDADSAAELMRLTFENVFPNAKDMADLQNYSEFALQVATSDARLSSIHFHAECAEMAYNMVVEAYLEQQEWGHPWKPDALYSHYNGMVDCTKELFAYGGPLLQ